MKEGWEIRKLGDVATSHFNINWKQCEEQKEYVDLSSIDRGLHQITETQLIDKQNAPSRAQRIIKTNDILFATTRPTLRRFCIVPDNLNNQVCSSGLCVIRPKEKNVCSKWIYMLLLMDSFYKYIEPIQKGASYPAVVDSDVFSYPIPIPPLSEQQRIVSKLDSVFEKIDALKANAENNLKNAKDLFQQVLKKEFEGDSTVLGEVLNLRRGHDLTHEEMRGGKIPVAGSGGIIGYHNVATPIFPCLTIGRSGSVGKVYMYDSCWAHNTVLYVDDFKGNNPYYLKYLMLSLDLHKLGGGCGVPTLNRNNLHPTCIGFNHNLHEQQRIVSILDSLSEKCKRLEENYSKTVAECDALKQSILREVMSGE